MLRKLEWPPVWLALFMAAMWALAHAAPLASAPRSVWLGRLIIALALGVMLWAALTMWRARTTVIPRQEAEALVTNGPFAWSRNPIYAADMAVLIGWAVSLGALSPWIVAAFFPAVIAQRFIKDEEAALARRFPQMFQDYKRRVRRWI